MAGARSLSVDVVIDDDETMDLSKNHHATLAKYSGEVGDVANKPSLIECFVSQFFATHRPVKKIMQARSLQGDMHGNGTTGESDFSPQ